MEDIPVRRRTFGTAATYLLLILLGALEGLIGSFEFSRQLGPVPAAALAFCVLIFATCLLGGIGMASPAGGLMPALGWFVATVGLSLPTPGGSVIVTDTAAGKWYLYGGAISAGVGMALTFRSRSRRPVAGPMGGPANSPAGGPPDRPAEGIAGEAGEAAGQAESAAGEAGPGQGVAG